MESLSDYMNNLENSLKNPDGSYNREKILDILLENETLKKNYTEVISEVTRGLLKNSHYPASSVLPIYHSYQKDLVDKNKVCEDMIHLVGKDEGFRQLIEEYFGKLY